MQDFKSNTIFLTVNVCSHFLVPKDGTPLSGLIQDHVVAGVRLTIRGRFFHQRDYFQLVNFALGSNSRYIETEPPTILKPVTLWSGKQVISTIIKNLVPEGKALLSFNSSAKIKANVRNPSHKFNISCNFVKQCELF